MENASRNLHFTPLGCVEKHSLFLYTGIMSKFVPCRTCATKEGPAKGYYFVNVEGSTFVKECDCHKKWVAKQRLTRKLVSSNVWTTPYSPSDYVGELSRENLQMLQQYIDRFEDKFKDKTVYFYGGNGTQKTTVAMWVAQSLVKKNFDVYYTLMETLTSALLPDYNNQNPLREEILRRSTEADLLVVDESFDKSKQTLYKSGYHIPFIDRFLRERIDVYKKATIFISNIAPSAIAAQGFGDSLQSLISRNVQQATLLFRDVYINNCNVIDSKGIFR